jgi:hypothetical protein
MEQARDAAMRYSASLPDFLCTEIVHRVRDPEGNGRVGSMDRLTVKLSYFSHKEDYKLMEIDGKPAKLDYFAVGGAVSTGEFGTRLRSIFHPESHGEFRWKGWTTLRKRHAARFAYRIALASSNFLIQYGLVPGGGSEIVVAYHGDVYVDEETHMTLRFTQEAEIPVGFPISLNDSMVDYEFAAVGGKQYLLPSHAYIKTRSGRSVAENNVEFREYRKFQSDTSITFGSAPEDKH